MTAEPLRLLRPFRGPLIVFGVFVIVQVASGVVLFARKLGLSPNAIADYYRGSEALFTRPKTMPGLLEVAVPHLVAIPMVLFVTIHLVTFAGIVAPRLARALSAAAFAVALALVAGGFLVRFVTGHAAVLKLVAFVAFVALLALWLVLLAVALLGRTSSGAGDAS